MANTFIAPEVVVNSALGLLERQLISARLVTRLGAADFVGAKDDTVTMRVEAFLEARDYEWRTRTAAIVVDDLEELTVPVRLDKHPYQAVAITDEDLTLSIDDFGRRVLTPQMKAVARKIDGYVNTAIEGVALTDDQIVSGTDPWRLALEARKLLNAAGVPAEGRFLYLGANDEIEFLDHDKFVKANENGGNTSALRSAILGNIAGFTVVSGTALDADRSFAFHNTAFALANVAPVVPEGATAGATAEYEGFALRWIRDYDPNFLRDRSVVSAFAGVSSVEEGIGTVDEVPDTPYNMRVVELDLTTAAP